jgi:23S rRNA (cytidine1920-2'-O)/16S rRNA (cytidine1409-2'-O)-methyltransferase
VSPAPSRTRLDVWLVVQGLVESREKAQALVMSGRVQVDGTAATKPGTAVPDEANVSLLPGPDHVGRGAIKLAGALEAFAVEPAGQVAVDVGASTGGFTDCLLQAGAARVTALDVGYGQLHPRLRADGRVTVLERTNAREVASLPYAPELIVCDVSFISVKTALPPLLRLAAPGWEGVILVKPQFEAGKADAPKGVVRDPEVRRRVLHDVCAAAAGWGCAVAGVVDSGLPGPKGNREYLVHLRSNSEPTDPDDLDRWIADAVD